MTADERIEKLLNAFGQTISDLPTNYGRDHRLAALEASKAWNNTGAIYANNYICHLADVIDRMEIALETALHAANCDTCQFNSDESAVRCDEEESHYQIDDKWLEGEDSAR